MISTDAIREKLFGNAAIQGPWVLIWSEIETQLHHARQQIGQETTPAIYDATNAVLEHRREIIQLARSVGFTHITGLWLDIPLEVCLHRNRQRDRRVPDIIIQRMYQALTLHPPHVCEGLDGLIRYSFPG